MSQNQTYLQNDVRYRNARGSLLAIILFSVVNIFSLIFTETYFLFSAYLPQQLIYVGLSLQEEMASSILLVVCSVIAVIIVVPYLLCWIFSNKHIGWMIAALCLFSIDSLLFLVDFVAYIQLGAFDMILDLIIRAWALSSLAFGVKHGLDAKKRAANEPLEGEAVAAFAENGEAIEYSGLQRAITLSRKKAFTACLNPMAVYVNGKEICRLKNGEEQTLYVPEETFVLKAELVAAVGATAQLGATQGSMTVNGGNTPLAYTLYIKSGFSSATIEFTQTNA